MNFHVAFPSGEKKELEESQLRLEWEQGAIPKESLYWKEGMDEWKPLSPYFSPYATPLADTSLPPVAGAGEYNYTVDPRKLTKVLVVMLGISLAWEVIFLISNCFQYGLLTGGSFTVAEGEANDARQAWIGIVGVVCFIVTGITFLKWIRRANINCRGFGAAAMEFTPGWSIGWYFIPIASLFKPYQAMREIWKVSHDPKGWQMIPSGGLLKAWWIFWVLNNILGQVSSRMSGSARDFDSLVNSTSATMLSSVVGIISTAVAIRLVRKIAACQQELVGGGNGE